jgi:starch synthase
VSRLGVPPSAFSPDGVEYYGNMSFLKGGLHYADRITTVSPNYAREIQHEPLGMGMQGLLAHRAGVLTGILNGIDTDAWDPESDPYIAKYYNAARLPVKLENKRVLQDKLGLAADEAVPLVGLIGRFTHQKGFDLVLQCAADLLRIPVQLAVLGSGDAQLQEGFQQLARTYPGKVGVHVGYDESMAHLIEAGADIFLMPSRFEPCGLNQMYSLRYGTVPIVRRTGGLADTVSDWDPARATGNGFVFGAANGVAFAAAIRRALAVYRDAGALQRLRTNGMAADFSWRRSAQHYLEAYAEAVARRRAARDAAPA